MIRDERGMVAGAEALMLGVLVFVLGTLLVANAWAVIDAKLAVTAAAREAARTYVEAADVAGGATSAQAAAEAAMAAHGRTGAVALRADGDAFGRCARVTITAEYEVQLAAIPVIAASGRTLTVVGRHSEIVDPYRDAGPAGPARCSG